ncbi:MAG: type II toxin-antitoxin system RelE/ParE family toxin [Dehalococcoidia bacterium]|nr:type II toxin-antitoxin system RelE/ParE family toxin [Dehalococcoidia bacterium]
MYGVELKASAEKDILALASSLRRRILAIISTLGDNPRPAGIRKLEAEGGYRIRAGDYRIILEIDDHAKRVTIVRVKHRREVYCGH